MGKGLPAALQRYRIAAWVTGVGLLCLTAAMVAKYGFDQPRAIGIIGPIHGFVYMIYLVLALDLSMRARLSVPRMLWVMLAGTIPFLSFLAEHQVTLLVRGIIESRNVTSSAGGTARLQR